jgi:hypothetical protein
LLRGGRSDVQANRDDAEPLAESVVQSLDGRAVAVHSTMLEANAAMILAEVAGLLPVSVSSLKRWAKPFRQGGLVTLWTISWPFTTRDTREQ